MRRSTTTLLLGALAASCNWPIDTEITCSERGKTADCKPLPGGRDAEADAPSETGGTGGTTGSGGARTGGTSGTGTGGDAAGGGAGTGGSAPCNGACEPPTPVCDPASDTCVECLAEADCAGNVKGSVCDTASNKCVECTRKADCTGNAKGPICDTAAHACVECLGRADCASKAGKPACDTSTNTCVQCTAATDCVATASTPLCDTAANRCVACLAPADCKDAAASRCDANACKPCSADGDCTHISGKGVCNGGTCVQCTAAKPAACGTRDGTPLVCDSLARTCTTVKAGSTGLCGTCVSDAQCMAGELCVQDTLQTGTKPVVGYFCHWKKGDTGNGAPATCGTARPYVKTLTNVTSIDGQSSDICVLRVSSCPARNGFSATQCGTAAPDDSACGVSPPEDAKCTLFDANNYRCTMTCVSDDDCPPGVGCQTGLPVPVCSF